MAVEEAISDVILKLAMLRLAVAFRLAETSSLNVSKTLFSSINSISVK